MSLNHRKNKIGGIRMKKGLIIMYSITNVVIGFTIGGWTFSMLNKEAVTSGIIVIILSLLFAFFITREILREVKKGE